MISALSVWLRAGHAVVARSGADHDDGLFLRLARSLLAGEWLGPYNNLTLAKGMAYPLFIAVAHELALPLKLAEQGVWLCVSAAICHWVARRSGPWLSSLLFLSLALDPVFWDPELARVVREGLYISLSLAVVAAAAAIPAAERRLLSGAVFGLALGVFWLTREEGVWILPAVGVALLPCLMGGRRQARSACVSLAASGLAFALPVGAVAGLNAHYYGRAVTSEFNPGSFTRAYAALVGVHRDRWQPFILFPADARARAYDASSAARELQPYLEGAGGRRWRDIGCAQVKLAGACTEIQSGWFMWALRDAAAAAGHMGSAAGADSYWRHLADEIDLACDKGGLACDAPHRWTLAPPFRIGNVASALTRLQPIATIMAAMGSGSFSTASSQGTALELASLADMVGPIAPPPRVPVRRIVGWVAAPGSAPTVEFVQHGGQSSATLTVHGAPDVEDALPGFGAARFELVMECEAEACELALSTPGAPIARLALNSLRKGGATQTTAGRVSVETDEAFPAMPLTDGQHDLQQRWTHAIAWCYAQAAPILAVMGVLGLGMAAVRRRGDLALLAFAGGSLVAILSRLGLLAYLDATSIPAVNSLYASPTSPFVLILSVIGIHAGLTATRLVRLEQRLRPD